MELSTIYFYKRCAPKQLLFIEKKWQIRIEHSLWKSKLDTFFCKLLFWQTVTGWRHKTWYFHLTAVNSYSKSLLFRTHTASSQKVDISFFFHPPLFGSPYHPPLQKNKIKILMFAIYTKIRFSVKSFVNFPVHLPLITELTLIQI